MSNPQQPEIGRSRKTPSQDPDAAASVIEGQRDVGQSEPGGAVPPENQPGHHPPQEQDKPDLDAFAQRFGITEGEEGAATAADGPPAREPVKAALTGQRKLPAMASGKGGTFALGIAIASALAVVLGLLLNRKRRRGRGE